MHNTTVAAAEAAAPDDDDDEADGGGDEDEIAAMIEAEEHRVKQQSFSSIAEIVEQLPLYVCIAAARNGSVPVCLCLCLCLCARCCSFAVLPFVC